MSTTITIRDEATTGGPAAREWLLELLTERITVRELIRSRVHQEVKDHNARQAEWFQGLVQPEGTEREGRGFRMKTHRVIDWKEQFERAVEAFQRSRFLVLLDDVQVTDLDREVVLTPSTKVSFLRLLPLVGG